ncbi:FtsK/SpoIIIE domain-containing protein [Kineococcus rubinsiae]|uniref:FtsK/SpoIIIE domain-containing protein n=1 Tax=Kineococcus rubinsiae TaxID=2609562 RepID=UPI0014316C77|nr:FtsK/SpoIIIE domain-containing protein [Kineococcus rubinsiae]
MLLRLTVVVDSPVDVELDVAPGTPLRDVRAEIEAITGPWAAVPRVGGVAVADTAALGLPPLLRGAVLHVGVGASTPAVAPAPTVRVHVAGGPDAGAHLDLPLGEHLVGRRAGAAGGTALADPALSREHATLRLDGAGGHHVRDLGSTNGTALLGGGARTAVATGVDVAPGQRLAVGDSVLHVDPLPPQPAAVRADGAGHLLLNRSPRLRPELPVQRLPWPGTDPPRAPSRLPVLALLVPLAVAGVLAVLWKPLSLLLGLATPVLVLGQWWSERRRTGDDEARRRAAEAAGRDDVLRRHRAALTTEHARRHEDAPDPAALLAEVVQRGTRVFERGPGDPDHLVLRVGLGEVEATSSRVEGQPPGSVTAETTGDAPPGARLDDVPLVVRLREVGVLGLAGPRPAVLAGARAVLAQVAAWQSPQTTSVAVVCSTSGSAAWTWATWLPHTRTVEGVPAVAGREDAPRLLGALVRELRGRVADRPGAPARHVVLVVDGAHALRGLPELAELLRDGPAAGIHTVCLDATHSRLPAECGAVLLHGRDGAADAVLLDAGGEHPLRPDGTGAAWAEDVARALAPLRDATPVPGGADLPGSCRLLDLLPAAATDAAALAAAWAESGSATRAVLGRAGSGPCVVDLATDGPHTLVAGTTGSGKSVLLQALVVSLAAGAPPDALQLVLVDYKGGAAFAGCAGLPHVAGLVTDLDDQLAARALRSLQAEVRRREAVLRRAGAPDVAGLSAAEASRLGLPRLVVVVDEFRVLAEELPDFVAGLVRLAVVGRSLGIHLVLATQRPSGVVSPEIRANTNLRIALRVQDRADAEDVVGDPAPARFSDRVPGRAALRRGTSGLETFQAATLSWTRLRTGPRVRRVGSGAARPHGPAPVDDLPGLLATIDDAARRRGRPAPPRPWWPALPSSVASRDLVGVPADVASPRDPGAVLTWGLRDLPDEQRRARAAWDLAAGGHLLVVGTVRSGRSTVLRTLAAAAAEVSEVHVLDGGGTLGDLARYPHVGSVVGRGELWRAGRLLTRLQEEVDRRRTAFARTGAGDLAEQRARAAAGAAGDAAEPYLVLLVDGWDGWAAALAQVDLGAGVDALQRLLREGSAAGVRVVLTGDRGLLTSPVAAAAADVLLLRLADRADAALLGLRARDVPRQAPAGRGLLVRDGVAQEVQVALPTPGAASPPTERPGPPRTWRARVDPLPDAVALAGLTADPAGVLVPLGVGGDDATEVGLPVDGTVVVAGPPGSGRSTALRTLALGLRGRAVLVTADPAARQGLGVPVLGPGDGADLAQRLGAEPGTVVLVDDVLRLLDTPVEEVLLRRAATGAALRIVASADGTELAGSFRGLPAALRSARTVLLLGRGGTVPADLLGRRPVLSPAPGPGAGFLVVDGTWTAVRVAAPAPLG